MSGCMSCGLCKPYCPLFNIILRETVSPRGKWMAKKAAIADDIFFLCTNCKLCTKNCPVKAELKIEDERARVIQMGVCPAVNEKILQNIKKFGNPFGQQDAKAEETSETGEK